MSWPLALSASRTDGLVLYHSESHRDGKFAGDVSLENVNICLLDTESSPGETVIDYDSRVVTECDLL